MSGLAPGALAPDAPERDAFAAPWSAVYVAILFIIATLPTLISPALVEGWHEQFGWAEGQLGMLAAADLVGLAVGGGSALFWQRRWPCGASRLSRS